MLFSLITKKELATQYSVSQRTVENWMSFLPYVKVGGVVRFDRELCDEVLLKFERNAQHRVSRKLEERE
jgi:hypothetical protein